MASKIFITGSSDGLGARAANALIARGHSVFVHGRNASRANDAEKNCPGAAGAFTADLSSSEDVKALAKALNVKGSWDVYVVHLQSLCLCLYWVASASGERRKIVKCVANTIHTPQLSTPS